MDLFKFGLRSVLGVTMPGAILVSVFLYVFFSVIYALNRPPTFISWGKDQQFLILATLFLASYVLGSLMRLNAADLVDEKSAEHHRNKYKEDKGTSIDEKRFEEIREQLLKREQISEIPKEFDEWIWRNEEFPYPVWQFRKFQLYHPEEAYRFFDGYRRCMGFGYGGRGKEFFNYCKMVIYHASRQLGDAVIEEIHFAEALVRFYAGTYYGLGISRLMLSALFIFHLIALFSGERVPSSLTFKVLNTVMTISLIAAVYRMRDMIVQRFRTLRLKEVDTVYDAFYLVHRHVDTCSICSPGSAILSTERHQSSDDNRVT